MRKSNSLRYLTMSLVLPLATLQPAQAGADDAHALLVNADRIRNPDDSFSVNIILTDYRDGKVNGKSAITVYSKPAPDSGQYNNLVRYVQPSRDSGKLVLRNGLDVWFYDPSSKASVRISPQARLLGQASNGDVMTTRLDKDYSATIVEKEKLDDPAGAIDAIKLRLLATRADAPYPRVDYWVAEGNNRPLKAQYFTGEGRLLKTAFFRRYQTELGRERPTETVIVDGLYPQWITVMRSSSYAQRSMPASWLQRDYLPRFSDDND